MKKIFILFFTIFIFLQNSSLVYAGAGCCSWHGGQDYCSSSGYWVCSDGWQSSCACNNGSAYYNSSSDSNDSDAQIYFFWLPLGIIFVINIIKVLIDSNSDIDKDEYKKFKELVDNTVDKYENKRYKEIRIILDDKDVIDALCLKRGNTIDIVNVTKSKEAYRLYKAGFFNEDGVLKSENKFLIYDKYGFVYYKYTEIRTSNFILSEIFDKKQNNYKSTVNLDYQIVKVVITNIETNRKWTFDLEVDSLYLIKEYIPESKVTTKHDTFEKWTKY